MMNEKVMELAQTSSWTAGLFGTQVVRKDLIEIVLLKGSMVNRRKRAQKEQSSADY